MAYDVLYIDHGNPDAKINYNKLKSKAPHTVTNKTQIKTNEKTKISVCLINKLFKKSENLEISSILCNFGDGP